MVDQPTPQVGAVILDWAGTMVDFGSRAPTRVFEEVFRRQGVPITSAQAREPMGMAKREHIAAVARMPEVAQRWVERMGQAVTEVDIDEMYEQFLPLQKSILNEHSELIPGALTAYEWLRSEGIKIGSSTGYTRELMEVVKPLAQAQGYQPDVVLCAEDAPQGRPAPWLIFKCCQQLGVYPLQRVIKVDDTVVGIEAGRNAGCWTVGVIETGNLLGRSVEELTALSDAERNQLKEHARTQMEDAGAHFVIDGVRDLPAVVGEVNQRLAQGTQATTTTACQEV